MIEIQSWWQPQSWNRWHPTQYFPLPIADPTLLKPIPKMYPTLLDSRIVKIEKSPPFPLLTTLNGSGEGNRTRHTHTHTKKPTLFRTLHSHIDLHAFNINSPRPRRESRPKIPSRSPTRVPRYTPLRHFVSSKGQRYSHDTTGWGVAFLF